MVPTQVDHARFEAGIHQFRSVAALANGRADVARDAFRLARGRIMYAPQAGVAEIVTAAEYLLARPEIPHGPVRIAFTPDEEAFRQEARRWLEANVPAEPLPSFDTREGFEAHRQWERTLHAAGWAVVSWPVEYGGRGVNLVEWLMFEEEYYRAGAPGRVGQNGLFLLGPTLMDFGTPEQKARFLPRMAAADDVWCQGWSEPDAGSDLAGGPDLALVVQCGDGRCDRGEDCVTCGGDCGQWIVLALAHGELANQESVPELERARHRVDAHSWYDKAIQQIDGHPGQDEVMQRIRAFRLEAAELLGVETED